MKHGRSSRERQGLGSGPPSARLRGTHAPAGRTGTLLVPSSPRLCDSVCTVWDSGAGGAGATGVSSRSLCSTCGTHHQHPAAASRGVRVTTGGADPERLLRSERRAGPAPPIRNPAAPPVPRGNTVPVSRRSGVTRGPSRLCAAPRAQTPQLSSAGCRPLVSTAMA